MPCESCNVQFTVFRRKRICNECRRFYCSQCLVKRNSNILCERCIVFTTRPISKVDLLKLKPKDLIFYLQSKHISTAGCVEKEELVNLILAHVNSDGDHMPNNNNTNSCNEPSSADNSEHCSNPFDQLKQTCQNLFSSFTDKITADFNFDLKNSPTNTNSQPNISDQPRISTREIPTYASSIHQYENNISSTTTGTSTAPTQRFVPTINIDSHPMQQINIGSHSSSSVSSPSSPIISISSFSSQSISSQCQTGRIGSENVLKHKNGENVVSSDNISRNTSASNKLVDSVIVDCSGSGCECSDEEMVTKLKSTNRLGQSHYQQGEDRLSPMSYSPFEDHVIRPNERTESSSEENKNSEESSGSSFEELGAVGGGTSSDTEHWQIINKTETSPFMENEIIGDTPDGATTSSDMSGNQTFQSHSSGINITNEIRGSLPRPFFNLQSSYGRDDDGIHVYGHESSSASTRHTSRFINLSDFKSSSELDELSVKQLKEILMLNRVDYKGCCEKHELLERVHRLWNDLQISPAVDKLQVDDLCKICMDAPIECVILECGHMATCTQCGKVLSECPICRQYIVRVVRFFRA